MMAKRRDKQGEDVDGMRGDGSFDELTMPSGGLRRIRGLVAGPRRL